MASEVELLVAWGTMPADCTDEIVGCRCLARPLRKFHATHNQNQNLFTDDPFRFVQCQNILKTLNLVTFEVSVKINPLAAAKMNMNLCGT